MTNKTDKQVFNDVFKDLRKQGFIARQNYACCQSCGWAQVEDDYDVNDDSNIVFYHGQDADSFENGELKNLIHLAWQGNGDLIKETFEKYGFNVDWNGSEHKRIAILPRKDAFKIRYKTNHGNIDTVYAFDMDELKDIKVRIKGWEMELIDVKEVPKRELKALTN